MKDYVNFFWEAPIESIFNQRVVASVLQISEAKLERDRWQGNGIPYLKLGKTVRYRKQDVLDWVQQYQPHSSTSQETHLPEDLNNATKK